MLVSNYVGNLLLTWSSEVSTYVTIKPSSVEYFNDDDMMPTRASVYFIFFTFVLVVIITTLWVTVYFIQKYRYQTAKKRLEVITPLLLRFLFQSKRIFNWFYSNDLEKTAKSDHESIVQNGSSSNQSSRQSESTFSS